MKVASNMREIGGYKEDFLLKAAQRETSKALAASRILSKEAEQRIPRFEKSEELVVGKILGRGGFCQVSDIKQVSIAAKTETTTAVINDSGQCSQHDNFFQDRSFMASHYIRDGRRYRYAIKTIQPAAHKDAELFVKSVMDLAIESRYLSVLRHPNIIKLRAVASTSPYEPEKQYFVVIDKLYDILSDLLRTKWKDRMPGPFTIGKKKKAQEFWAYRLTVAMDLASALSFLHSKGICYRDLKPHNVGLDVRGDVKIFDFGLVREMTPNLRNEDGTYNFTGRCGTLRYMAPEVALGKPYNEKADVYGFSILLWQILSVVTPFDVYITEDYFFKTIVNGGLRPENDRKWPESLTSHMKAGWDGDWTKRPSMEDFHLFLQDAVYTDHGVEHNMADISRKSFEKLMGQ
mmetsp:Transcript_16430/g.45203  ORF Transcript_16430/g.45203 Transcript_16430/m.45203 type:complete len:404 (-) Transcript_16430:2176-3387(-)